MSYFLLEYSFVISILINSCPSKSLIPKLKVFLSIFKLKINKKKDKRNFSLTDDMEEYGVRLLRQIGEEQGLGVECSIAERKCSGSNFHGRVSKVVLEGNGKSLDVIVKIAPVTEGIRVVQKIPAKFLNEVHLYTVVFPELTSDDKPGHLIIPKVFGWSLEPGKEMIVMEDMCAQGFETKSLTDGVDLAHCQVVLKALASVHTLSFDLKKKKPEKYKELVKVFKETIFNREASGPDQFLGVMLRLGPQQLIDCSEAHLSSDYVGKAKALGSTWVEDILSSVELDDESVCLTHGDTWLSNILFKYDEKGVVDKCCLVDWQMTRLACPYTDVMEFLLTSTESDLLNHLKTLIGHYQADARVPVSSVKYGLAMCLLIFPFVFQPDTVTNLPETIQGIMTTNKLPPATPQLSKRLALTFKMLVDTKLLG